MKIRFYQPKEEDQQELKEPLFDIQENVLMRVDENGEVISNLLILRSDDRFLATPYEAKKRLELNSYRTDWAIWGDDGRFKGFK